jgi:hypothetical protein
MGDKQYLFNILFNIDKYNLMYLNLTSYKLVKPNIV